MQAREFLDAFANSGPLFAVKVELNQNRGGTLSDIRLLEGSGNERFDRFVLRSMPDILERVGTPPAELFRGKRLLRTQWQVDRARLLRAY